MELKFESGPNLDGISRSRGDPGGGFCEIHTNRPSPHPSSLFDGIVRYIQESLSTPLTPDLLLWFSDLSVDRRTSETPDPFVVGLGVGLRRPEGRMSEYLVSPNDPVTGRDLGGG